MNTSSLKPLKGHRVLTLALNLPGPAAAMRLRAMGARCVKLEPLAPPGQTSADPMAIYNPAAYTQMHEGIQIIQADLKAPSGQKVLHRQLSQSDILLTSFRPSALKKLGLKWQDLRKNYPQLIMISIVGSAGAQAEEPGHDLTYLAQNGLIHSQELPATLYADMGGSLLTTEAVLKALLSRQVTQRGSFQEIALNDAAAYLALPRHWGLTTPQGDVGGAHAGYRIYACKNGRVAMAALEPHFAQRLCLAAGLKTKSAFDMHKKQTHQKIADFLMTQTRAQLDQLAHAHDIPMHTLSRQ